MAQPSATPTIHEAPERQPLRSPVFRGPETTASYGSINSNSRAQNRRASDLASLELPDPALDPGSPHSHPSPKATVHFKGNVKDGSPATPRRDTAQSRLPDTTNKVGSENKATPSLGGESGVGSASRNSQPSGGRHKQPESPSTPSFKRRPSLLKRVFSLPESREGLSPSQQFPSQYDRRQQEFFEFLDGELSKIESFYETKENEAIERLRTLRQQLHIMGDQRIQEINAAKAASKSNGDKGKESNGLKKGSNGVFKNPIKRVAHFGKTSESLPHLTTPVALQPHNPESVLRRRDYSRRPGSPGSPGSPAEPITPEVSYHSAKKKLKIALQEFYRGLELLKSYALLNRTAFRKINKKYDKAVQARPTLRYMSEKVNKAWFVQSEVTDDLLSTVEDLYSRYFERGNRKVAVSKLRRMAHRAGDYSLHTFVMGLLLMGGALFAIQALVYAEQHLHHSNELIRTRTSYLLQVCSLYRLLTLARYKR